MKKTGMLLAALWAAWVLCGGALAAQYADVEALLTAWTQEGMPDYVSSVCSVDGSSEHLAILLTPGNEDREAEIRASLTDDSGVTIGVGAYSWAERERVLHEIAHEHMDGGAVVTIGDGWITMDGQITGFGESGLESRVVVGVLADRAEEYRTLFAERYGDMVYVEPMDGAPSPSALSVPAEAAGDGGTAGERAPAGAETPAEPALLPAAAPTLPAQPTAAAWLTVAAGAAILLLCAVLRRRAAPAR